MKIKRVAILWISSTMLIIFFSGCKSEDTPSEVVRSPSNDMIDLREFLIDNRKNVIGFDHHMGSIFENPDMTVSDFIQEINRDNDKSLEFEDSLLHHIRLPEFEHYYEAEEYRNNEVIRLMRFSFSFGDSSIEIFQGMQSDTSICIQKKVVRFDTNCNTPYLGGKGKNTFTTKCFSLLTDSVQEVSLDTWNSLRREIIDTDLLQTAFFESGKYICDGYEYILEYTSVSNTHNDLIRLEKSCPGLKSSIYLVSERLIEIYESTSANNG